MIQKFYTICGGSKECLVDIAIFGDTRIAIKERNKERQNALLHITDGLYISSYDP